MTLHAGGQRLEVVKRRIVARDGATCGRCHRRIDLALSGLAPMGLTLGHIVPVIKGGSDDDDNLRPEHRSCNLAAGAMTDDQVTARRRPRATIAVPIQETS